MKTTLTTSIMRITSTFSSASIIESSSGSHPSKGKGKGKK